HSTGGKQKLLGISKRGNRYVRKLLVHGARSCFRHLDRSRDRLGAHSRASSLIRSSKCRD
ncbi:transposase, partial [Mesorhizobium sp. M0674]|uniref:transposase n=1 Tax=unclassified Mesorhizobium TaxID=325217 RepID=UPI0033359F08